MSYEAAYDAIVTDDLDSLRRLVAAEPALAGASRDLPDWPDSTLLEHAVWWCRADSVDALVAAGAPVHRPGGTPPQSPLQRALEMGADGLVDQLGPATDLESAAGLGDTSGVRSRLDEADTGMRRRAFRLACLNGRRETVRLLCPDGWFDKDALVDALLRGRHLLTWDDGETAWDWARFQLELADPLNVLPAAQLPHGAASVRSSRGVPPERVWRPMNSLRDQRFLFACQWAQTSRVREFLAADPELVHCRTMWDGGSLYLPGAYGSTGSVDTALLLLEAGARPYDGIGGPAWWGAVDMVLALLDHGAPTEWRERRESGLLHACAATRYNEPDNYRHWLPIIEGLLDHGADPNYADRFGVTPWGFAHDAVRPLLEARGARPEARRAGLADFRDRLRRGESDIVDRALAEPELLDFYDEETGCTPALAALAAGDRRLADALLAAKPRIDINEAAAFGELAALEALLDDYDIAGPRAGAGPPHVPLHFAAWFGEFDAAELLLARGYSAAAMNRADEAGKYQGIPALRDTTPLHVAAKAGQATVLGRLSDAWHTHWQPL